MLIKEVTGLAPIDKNSINLDQLSQEEGVVSLLLVANPFTYQSIIEGMESLVLIVTNNLNTQHHTEHRIWKDTRIQIRRVTPSMLEGWVVSSPNRNIIYWLVQGDILIDHDGFLTKLRDRLINWSPLIQEQKLLSEFSQFVRAYLQAKQDLRDGQVLDAYSNVLSCLHCWAHIALVEQGMNPDLTVWEQIRIVNPGIYKLLEELTSSGETLEQRVELVLLACEFTILNKMESSCVLLIRLIESRTQSWTPAELLAHPDLSGFSLELSVLLRKLVNRGCIREVVITSGHLNSDWFELGYTSVANV
ncbi:nucleotidyltransferase-like protein [Cohnella sp. WQ 127256]|uniref:nucleotidyltransferase-like protein n=1 Tax=Cohnella sp. WQ 127256 TaxID=2938790 RepID=UPI002119279E|nr:nucleotidyltransferase-like protein [Cohnella sp. WQ 127256]